MLAIAVSLNLMDLIKAPKVVAAINRIYKSDYDIGGSFFEMSSAYQILSNTFEVQDQEKVFRFYQNR